MESQKRGVPGMISLNEHVRGLKLWVTLALLLVGGVISIVAQNSAARPNLKVRVVSFSPDGITDPNTDITIEFSADLVSRDSLDRPEASIPVVFDPPISGLARWVDTDVLRLSPDQPLRPATAYEARLVAGGGYVNGNAISDSRKFAFRTQPFTAEVAAYRAQQVPRENNRGEIYLDLKLNYPVAWEDVVRKLEITGAENATRSSLEIAHVYPDPKGIDGGKPSKTFQLITEKFDLAKVDQQYRLRLGRGLRCVDCDQGLPEDAEFIMTVSKQLPAGLFVESAHAFASGRQILIEIRFSDDISVEDLRENLTLEPAVKHTIESSWRGVLLRGDFAPQTVYTVAVAAGLTGQRGGIMARDFSQKIETGDLEPAVNFTSPGIYMPRHGAGLLEIETINIDTVTFEIEQIFDNNLVTYLAGGATGYNYGRGSNLYGRRIIIKDLALPERLNEPVLSTADIGGIVGDSLKGIFSVAARNKKRRWTGDARQVMLTDLGLMARMSEDHLMVWVHALSDTDPVKKATVRLMSKNNQVLLEGRTNSQGAVVFDDIHDQTVGFEPFLITVEKDGDLSYLRISDGALPIEDFDVSGRPYLNDGYQAFLYLERDIYRPGEKGHLVAMVRDGDGEAASSFPYNIVISDPRGREFKRFRMDAAQAMSEVAVDFPAELQTGRYTVRALIGEDNEIGRTELLIEEFVPDRIRVEVSTPKDEYLAGEKIEIDVDGRYLFGAPAAGLQCTGTMRLVPTTYSAQGYAAYSFGDPDKEYTRQELKLGDTVLCADGKARFIHSQKKGLAPPSMLRAEIAATVQEPGGRTISGYHEVAVHAYPRYIGLRNRLEGYARPGQPVTVDIVTLKVSGEPTPATGIDVRFYRVVHNSTLRKDNTGRYRYVSTRTRQLVDSTVIDLDRKGSVVEFTPAAYGSYEIVASDPDGGHAAATSFYASGWGYAPWSMEQPDKLEIALDRESYEPGQTALVQVQAPFAGRLLLTVEGRQVLEYLTVDIPENTAEIKLPVKSDWFPNVYVTGTLIRPAAQVKEHAPARAYGLAPLMLGKSSRELPLRVTVPGEVKPNTQMTIEVDVGALVGSRLAVAAVDAGILQLTGMKTPDPLDFFFGKKRPALALYDIYTFLYPELARAESHLSTAGGADRFASERGRHLNPLAARRFAPVSLWSGIVTPDSTGHARIEFDIPRFNGELVIMVVGTDHLRFGSRTARTLVREDVIVQESFPRFVSPNDIVDGLVTVHNNTDTTVTAQLSFEYDGDLEMLSPSTVDLTLAPEKEQGCLLRFQAGQTPGVIKVGLTCRTAQAESVTEFELANRPARPIVTKFGSGVATNDVAAWITFPGEWLAGTERFILHTSSLPAAAFKRQLDYLLHYPYGCLEQTTSSLFPLLFFNDLVKFASPGLFGGHGHEYFIAEGIDKLLRMQREDGSFSYWPGGDRLHNWSAIYAAHFLVEASLAGFEVDTKAHRRTVDFLLAMARGKDYSEIAPSHRIYACYVLAKAGKLGQKQINYLTGLDTSTLPSFARYQLAATLAITGDIQRARELVPMNVQPDIYEPEDGGDFSSGVRNNAILLDMLLTVDPDNPSAGVLAKSLVDDARIGRWYNTQDNAFALMALGKYYSSVTSTAFTGQIRLGDSTSVAIDTTEFVLERDDLGGQQATITIEGEGQCFYYWQAGGIPSEPVVDEFERGIRVAREYLDDTGSPVDMQNVKLGQQLIVRLTLKAVNKALRNVVVNDLLPAGLEVENPRLKSTPRLSWLPKQPTVPEHMDIRDDRVLLFVHLSHEKEQTFHYSVRAICAGEFVVPPIAAECMYNPVVAGASSSGLLKVSSGR
ncbi:MAG: MG2 domain-containing protein [bacterium]